MMEPPDLARELGIDAKKLRSWLRRTYPRSLVDHNSRWALTPEQVAAARNQFSKRSARPSPVAAPVQPPPEQAARPAPSTTAADQRPLWEHMDAQRGHDVRSFKVERAPTAPGVYAFYRGGAAVYVGRAVTESGIRSRLRTHTATGVDLSHSSFRRNVAEHLGVAPTSVTRARPPQLTLEQVEPVNKWISGCTIRWVEATTVDEARQLEEDMKAEWKPPLTKR